MTFIDSPWIPVVKQFETRLEALEVKLAFQEQTVDALNEALVKKELDMAEIRDQIARLSGKLDTMSFSCGASTSEEPPPPHY